MVEIILVCLQNFQKYIIDNIYNLIDFSNNNITVITDKHLISNFDIVKDIIKIISTENLDNYNFDNNCKLNKLSQDGLWFQSSNRFFYVYNYIQKNNIENCFHIENDVMIYDNLSKYIPNDKKLYLPMCSNTLCIPSIIFIPSHNELYILIKNYNFTTNDMNNLATFYNNNKKICDSFPIIKYNTSYNKFDLLNYNFDKFNSIFDAASIGQYLGGQHYGVKIPGFVYEKCMVKYNKYKFFWIKINSLYIPHIKIDDEIIRIINLHIHRKNLNKFTGKNPLETTLIKFLSPSIENLNFTTKKQKKSIAILYFGLLRSFDKVYNSHINNIFNILSENNFEYKIFVHTWKTKNDNQRVWEKTIDTKQDYNQINMINPYKSISDDQEEFENNLNFNDYFYQDIWDTIGHSRNGGEWLPGLVKNHLCALESQKRVFKMVTDENINFDYVMFVRPDVKINDKFPINTINYLNDNENGILIPNFANHEGVNDRFAVINYNHSKYYANRIEELADYRKKNGRIVSEKYTGYCVSKYYKKLSIDFNFDIIRPL